MRRPARRPALDPTPLAALGSGAVALRVAEEEALGRGGSFIGGSVFYHDSQSRSQAGRRNFVAGAS